MRRADVLGARQIRDRPGHLERPVVGPRAESQLGDGRFEEPLPVPVDPTKALDLFRAHPGVAEDPAPAKSRQLDLMDIELSPSARPAMSWNFTAGTSTWMSSRSSSGPEILA
jgi:hypothetical protein